jgi:hypothetical protein
VFLRLKTAVINPPTKPVNAVANGRTSFGPSGLPGTKSEMIIRIVPARIVANRGNLN